MTIADSDSVPNALCAPGSCGLTLALACLAYMCTHARLSLGAYTHHPARSEPIVYQASAAMPISMWGGRTWQTVRCRPPPLIAQQNQYLMPLILGFIADVASNQRSRRTRGCSSSSPDCFCPQQLAALLARRHTCRACIITDQPAQST
jgi:hypothetical protein